MTTGFPSADEYAASRARHPPLAVVDIRSEQAAITDPYRNEVLLDVNHECLRLSVFEGDYRWHQHPDTDELFLLAAGELRIDFADGSHATLTEWQSLVVPAGTVHRTRAIGRTVNLTCEKRGARTVFVPPPVPAPDAAPGRTAADT